MHIFFSGIGGTAIGPLALIAKQAGYDVSGSDKQDSQYINYLREHGVTNITLGQSEADIAAVHEQQAIDWVVYSSAVAIENPDHPELVFARAHDIRCTKRDELLNEIIKAKHLKLVAIAGTHGKTTTTAMMIWLFKELGIPVSYSVGAKTSFAEMGHYEPDSQYFVYECDEYDRNFLSFHPFLSLITGIDWDHADIYPTREIYEQAFRDYIDQSHRTIMWQADADRLAIKEEHGISIIHDADEATTSLKLPGAVNRQDAWQVIAALQHIQETNFALAVEIMNRFPGVSRRFEQIIPGLYSDYAHTPEKIRGALQLAHEIADGKVVVIYEGLHNTRQHFIRDDLKHLFDDVDKLYVVPSYLAREDKNLKLLSPDDLIGLTAHPEKAETRQLDDKLSETITNHLNNGDVVLCLTAGGGNSLDEWLRQTFRTDRG
ncbi:hypothetical protein KA047_00425 [Candidatus Saccharibacteria bacterium]|nr:hypothetical protein [Candidatus Saccharibacteria bacterium]